MTGAFDAAWALRAGLGDRRQAWEYIREFAAAWTAPLGPGDGVSADVLDSAERRIGAELPAALREAYLLFGRRPDLTTVQDPLVPPGELGFDNSGNAVVFRVENQRCAAWGIAAADLSRPDPPVYVRHRGGWQPFLDRFSTACVEMVLSEVLLGRRQLGDMCELPAELITKIESAYDQLPVPEYPSWYDLSITVRWFSAPGKLLRLDGRGPRCWLVAGCQTLADLESIRATIPGPWVQVQWPREESR
jgi:hypothetical protein